MNGIFLLSLAVTGLLMLVRPKAGLVLTLALGACLLPGHKILSGWLWLPFAIPLAYTLTPLRRHLLMRPALALVRRALPPMSATEREALEAGTIWWDAELFSGKPDWDRLRAFPAPHLSAEETSFLAGPTEALCAMLDDWVIKHELRDLPPDVWRYQSHNRADATGALNHAFQLVTDTDAIRQRLHQAVKDKALTSTDPVLGVRAGIISPAEATVLTQAAHAVQEVISVDDFDPAYLTGNRPDQSLASRPATSPSARSPTFRTAV